MTLQELQKHVLQLVIRDRIALIQSVLTSIQQETLPPVTLRSSPETLLKLEEWTQSLVGVIRLETEEPKDAYVDYLEEKYR